MGSLFAMHWGHGDVRAQAPAKDHVGFVVLLQPGSLLTSVVHVANKDYKDAQCLGCHL